MNYLAHIYLSGENDQLKIGNFIADHVKGRSYQDYSIEVQKGILLHRQIDSFTDNDPVFKRSKKRLDHRYGLYRGVVIDIFYDHLLARSWDSYSDVPLPMYSREFYKTLMFNYDMLPERVQYLTTHMIRQDWLSSYAEVEGIQRVLEGMDRRTKGLSGMRHAVEDLQQNYSEFELDFNEFFKKLCTFSDEKLIEITKRLS